MCPPSERSHLAGGLSVGALRLPREIESDARHEEVQRALAARTRKLWSGGTLDAAVVPLTETLQAALRMPTMAAVLQRGLEAAEITLSAEQRGFAALPTDVARRQGGRVSRLLLITNDGAERFYRQVERLVVTHAPRVLVCLVDCDSATLGGLLFGSDAVAKLVLTGHKAAAATILRSLAGP
jgi:hypothetical protein